MNKSGLFSATIGAGLMIACHDVAWADEIIVTGRGLSASSGDRAYSLVSLDRDQLNGTASGRIETAIRDVAGFAQFRRSDARSANPTSQGLNVRGFGGNASGRVLVLRDGVPQGDPFAGYLNWPTYMVQTIGQLRLIRGGGSGANGAGALVGTVEIDSLAVQEAPRLAMSIAGGSEKAVEASALASGAVGTGFAMIAANAARGDGFVPVVASQRGPVDRPAPYSQTSLYSRAIVPAGQGELQATLTLFNDKRERGADFSANSTRGADAALRFVSRRLSLTGYVQLRQFKAQFASVNTMRSIVTPTLDQYNVPATGLGLIAEMRSKIGATDIRSGGEWRHATGATNERFLYINGDFTRIRRAGGRSDIVGAFIEGASQIGAFTLTGGARIDYWRLSGGFRSEAPIGLGAASITEFPNRQSFQGTGRMGLAYDANSNITVRAATYLGWRLPTLNELYRPFRVGIEQTNANEALVPERSNGADIGVDWHPSKGVRIAIRAFAMQLDQAIANVTQSSSATAIMRQRTNIAGIMSQGVELDADWRTGDWRLTASAAIMNPRLKNSAIRPAQVARIHAMATMGWRGLTVTGRYIGPQFEDDANQRKVAGAFTMDATSRLALSKRVAVNVRIENCFDARVEAAISPTGIVERATPRTVWIGLSFL